MVLSSSAAVELGVFLESPLGSQSSFRVGACTCAFLPSCSSSVTLPVVPGASVKKPARDKVMRKEADMRKGCSDFRDPSGNS